MGTDPLVFCSTAARQCGRGLCLMNVHWGVGELEGGAHWNCQNCSWLLAWVALDFATWVPWTFGLSVQLSGWRGWSGKCSQGSGAEVHAEGVEVVRGQAAQPWAECCGAARGAWTSRHPASLFACARAQPVRHSSAAARTPVLQQIYSVIKQIC